LPALPAAGKGNAGKAGKTRSPGPNYEMTTTAAAAAASTVIADITNNVKCTKLWPQNEKD